MDEEEALTNAELTEKQAQLEQQYVAVRQENDAAITRFDGMVQQLSESVDQNRREVVAALTRCELLAAQLEQALARAEALTPKALTPLV
jgi:hypothetical protein